MPALLIDTDVILPFTIFAVAVAVVNSSVPTSAKSSKSSTLISHVPDPATGIGSFSDNAVIFFVSTTLVFNITSFVNEIIDCNAPSLLTNKLCLGRT